MGHYVYVAATGDRKIRLFAMEPETGKLAFRHDIELEESPVPMCLDPAKRTLYVGLRAENASFIGSFRIDPSGDLSQVSKVSLEADPCYLATDKTGTFLLGAYYLAGMVTVHRIDADGAVQSRVIDQHKTVPKAHYIDTDASNRYVFVPHVDQSNAIFQFHFDESTGKLTPNAIPKVDGGRGPQGPRHLVFHPNRSIVYADNEQGSSVTVYDFDSTKGTSTPIQTLSTLPPSGFDGENSTAQIRIHPTGKAVYASNRGHNSIAMFAVDPESGRIRSLGQQPTESVPRPFNLDPNGNYLFAAGQESGRMASYRIDAHGELEPLDVYEIGQSPAWVLPVTQPRRCSSQKAPE